jgi:hypothetical protein
MVQLPALRRVGRPVRRGDAHDPRRVDARARVPPQRRACECMPVPPQRQGTTRACGPFWRGGHSRTLVPVLVCVMRVRETACAGPVLMSTYCRSAHHRHRPRAPPITPLTCTLATAAAPTSIAAFATTTTSAFPAFPAALGRASPRRARRSAHHRRRPRPRQPSPCPPIRPPPPPPSAAPALAVPADPRRRPPCRSPHTSRCRCASPRRRARDTLHRLHCYIRRRRRARDPARRASAHHAHLIRPHGHARRRRARDPRRRARACRAATLALARVSCCADQ